jgi:hypothetical protein
VVCYFDNKVKELNSLATGCIVRNSPLTIYMYRFT